MLQKKMSWGQGEATEGQNNSTKEKQGEQDGEQFIDETMSETD